MQRARRVSVGRTVEAGLPPQDGPVVLGEAQQRGAVPERSEAANRRLWARHPSAAATSLRSPRSESSPLGPIALRKRWGL